MVYIGLYTALAIVGGNWNNTLLCGAFYANLNNTASNTNTNNGAAQSYPRIFHMKCSIYDTRQMLSYLGWLDCTDTYNMYKKWIKPHVNFQKMKRYGSKINRFFDGTRTYLKLASLYTAEGGSDDTYLRVS